MENVLGNRLHIYLNTPPEHAVLLDERQTVTQIEIQPQTTRYDLSPDQERNNSWAEADFWYVLKMTYPEVNVTRSQELTSRIVPFNLEHIFNACQSADITFCLVEPSSIEEPPTKRVRFSEVSSGANTNITPDRDTFLTTWKRLFDFLSISVPDDYDVDVTLENPQTHATRGTSVDPLTFGMLLLSTEDSLKDDDDSTKQTKLIATLAELLEEEYVKLGNAPCPKVWEQPLRNTSSLLETFKTMSWQDTIRSHLVPVPGKSADKKMVNMNQATRILLIKCAPIPETDWERIKPFVLEAYRFNSSDDKEVQQARANLMVLFSIRCQSLKHWPRLPKIPDVDLTDLKEVQGKTYIPAHDIYKTLIKGSKNKTDVMNKIYDHITTHNLPLSNYLKDVIANFSMNKALAPNITNEEAPQSAAQTDGTSLETTSNFLSLGILSHPNCPVS